MNIEDSDLLTVLPWSSISGISSSIVSPALCKRASKFYAVVIDLKNSIKISDTEKNLYGFSSLTLMNFQGISHASALSAITEAFGAASAAPKSGKLAAICIGKISCVVAK